MTDKVTRDFDNYLAMVHDLASGAERWTSRPAWLEFAPNNLCNLRCVMCGQSDGEPLVVMGKEDASRLLDEVLPTTSLWTPSALSEPMLANLALVVEKCRQHSVYLNFYSNATLLTGKRFAAIADRIQKLHISFDSHEKAVYERIRVRADFDQVVRNIGEVLAIAAERAIPVGFVVVLMADNVPHLAELVDFLAALGAARARCDIRVQPLNFDSKGCVGRSATDGFTLPRIARELDRACERARAHGINFNADFDGALERHVASVPPPVRGILPDVLVHVTETVRQRYPHFCRMVAYYMKIMPSGAVFPCCMAPHELAMGNVHEESVEAIWNGARYRTLRRRMFAGDYPAACRSCSFLVENPAFERRHEVRAGR